MATFSRLIALVCWAASVLLWVVPSWADFAAANFPALAGHAYQWTVGSRFVAAAISVTHTTLLASALWLAAGVFAQFSVGRYFEPAMGVAIRRMGVCMTLFGLLLPVQRMLVVAAATWHNPPGQRMLTLGLSSNDLLIIIFGVMITMLGYVQAEAARIAEDNAQIV